MSFRVPRALKRLGAEIKGLSECTVQFSFEQASFISSITYQKKDYKLRLIINKEYPFTGPQVQFIDPIEHPTVNPKTNYLCSCSVEWSICYSLQQYLEKIQIHFNSENSQQCHFINSETITKNES